VEITAFAIRVVLLFFPGIVCAFLVDMLVVHRSRTISDFLTRAFALGVLAYLTLYSLAEVWRVSVGLTPGAPVFTVTFFHALAGGEAPLAWGEIAAAGFVAALLSFPIAASLNHKVVNRLAAALSVSWKAGDLDVWGYVWNSPDTEWVDVRDVAGDILYRGQVRAFSETGEAPQLLLQKVEVFRISSGESLYRTGGVYLALPRECVVIDVHARGNGGARHG
jgi:hypothetical protein